MTDLDGVLANTFQIHVAGWLLVMDQLGVPPDAAVVDDLRGVPTRMALEILFRRVDISCTQETLVKAERIKSAARDREIRGLTPKHVASGARNLLRECSANGVEVLCLATSTAAPQMLDRLGLTDQISDIHYGGAIDPPKAISVDHIEKCIRNYSVDKYESLVLDDGITVVEHCLQASIPAVLVQATSDVSHLPSGLITEGVSSLYAKGCQVVDRSRS